MSGTTISGNSANGHGGGVYLADYARITSSGSIISGNIAGGAGGGVYSGAANSQLDFNYSTLSSNQSGGEGGGIFVQNSPLNVDKSTISNNTTATSGGGIRTSSAQISLTTSTVSGNLALDAAALSLNDSVTGQIYNSTIFNNTATAASGLGGVYISNVVSIDNTIIASNTSNDCDLEVGFTMTLNNWFGDATCDGVGQGDPILNELGDYNDGLPGTTLTHAPTPGSGVLAAGNFALCGSGGLETDQRGAARGDSSCDIGAVEGAVDANQLDDTNFIVIPLKNGKTVVVPL